MRTTHLLIFGSVHGVGFRNFVRHYARKAGLVGWVRNLPEGTVEIEVTGDQKRIEQLIERCRKGPFLSEVKNVEVETEEKDFPYTEFIMRHDLD